MTILPFSFLLGFYYTPSIVPKDAEEKIPMNIILIAALFVTASILVIVATRWCLLKYRHHGKTESDEVRI